MKTQKLSVYQKPPREGVDNLYPTSKDTFKQPSLHFLVGQRTAGKSFLASKILSQAQQDKTFDKIYMITPSFNSNVAYFGQYVNESDVFEPTKDSISRVIALVESDRDEWEQYLGEKEEYKKFLKDMKEKEHLVPDNRLLYYHDKGWLDKRRPTWKYEREEPPKSLLICDDILSSEAILKSSGLTKIATLNRHIAPLKEVHSQRSACGLGVMILSQTYRMTGGIGRCLRENVSLLTLFKNRQEKQLNAIREELANVCDLELFDKAYNFATNEKYGNLTVDFNPKCSSKVFRKNLNEVILFDALKCECKKK